MSGTAADYRTLEKLASGHVLTGTRIAPNPFDYLLERKGGDGVPGAVETLAESAVGRLTNLGWVRGKPNATWDRITFTLTDKGFTAHQHHEDRQAATVVHTPPLRVVR